MITVRGIFAIVGVVALATAVGTGSGAIPLAAAAGSTVVEAESMTISPTWAGGISPDTTASGGASLILTSTSTASKKISVTNSSAVVVRAKGQQCSGAPTMAVTVDGVNIGTNNVTATKWTDFTSSKKVEPGPHTIGIAFTNQYWFICRRNLAIDMVTVVPDVVATTTHTMPTTPATSTNQPPTTPPPIPAAVTTAPKGDLPGWKFAFADDFTRSAATGSWDNGADPNKIVYVGAQGQQWRTYPSTYTDTYQHRPYRPAEVLSVGDGMLQFDLHNV